MNKLLLASAALAAMPIPIIDRRREADIHDQNLRRLIAEAERNGQKVVIVDDTSRSADYDESFANFLRTSHGVRPTALGLGAFGVREGGSRSSFMVLHTPEADAKWRAEREAIANEFRRKSEEDRQRKEMRKRCPKCRSRDVERAHHQGTFAVPECDFIRCNDCEHQWNHT